MTVTTELIGKLGGGGAPEVATTQVPYRLGVMEYRIPSGWRKALGVFMGTAREGTPTIFGQVFQGLMSGTSCSGGGRHQQRKIPGCLRHDHVGAPGITHRVVV